MPMREANVSDRLSDARRAADAITLLPGKYSASDVESIRSLILALRSENTALVVEREAIQMLYEKSVEHYQDERDRLREQIESLRGAASRIFTAYSPAERETRPEAWQELYESLMALAPKEETPHE